MQDNQSGSDKENNSSEALSTDVQSITAKCWTPGGTWGQGFTKSVSIAKASGSWESTPDDPEATEQMMDLIIEAFKEAKQKLKNAR